MGLNRTESAILKRVLECRRLKTNLGSGSAAYAYNPENGAVGVPTRLQRAQQAVDRLIEQDEFFLCDRTPTHTFVFVVNKPEDEHEEQETGDMAKAAVATKTPKQAKSAPPKEKREAKPRELQRVEFTEKGTFRPGHDARLAGLLKRIIKGVATSEERKHALSKTILEAPAVVKSAHIQELVKEALKADKAA